MIVMMKNDVDVAVEYILPQKIVDKITNNVVRSRYNETMIELKKKNFNGC